MEGEGGRGKGEGGDLLILKELFTYFDFRYV